ncbi:MAG: phage holin family protein [Patescibacteria group bacterium]
MKLITKPFFGILFNGLALYALIRLVDGVTYTGGIKFFVLGGVVLGLINLFIKPLIKILSLPFVILTGGIFLVIINIGVLWLLKYFLEIIQFQNITIGFQSFTTYVIGALVFGIVNWAIHLID